MGRFRVLERIGSGGMGTVYRAFDERLQRHVAVKEVRGAEPDRIVREAQAAARLNHPGIVTLYELGEYEGRPLLVSELVPGDTLARLRAEGWLCDRDVAEIGADLCDALAHAHARGVVHRDIKPENVIVRDDQGAGRRAKLMDFGIARIAGTPTLTATGEVIGTLAYMSPEQAEGHEAGAESDVYSLALTLYECWAGENPVAGLTPAETARRIGAALPPLRLHRPDLPEGLADVVDACLEPDPELRPTVIELGDCVEAELRGLDVLRPLPGIEEPGARGPRSGISTARVGLLAALGVCLLALAGPLGAAGTALVLAVLFAPLLLAGAPAGGLAMLASPLLAAAGIGASGAALGAAGPRAPSRAILGAGAWAWLLTASLALGAGPELGIASPPAAGWSGSAATAATEVLGPLVALESLLGMAVFAVASVALGWLLRAGHVSVALLAAMLWAAAVVAALGAVGNGALAEAPAAVLAAAGAAVAIEFGLVRERTRRWGAEVALPAPSA